MSRQETFLARYPRKLKIGVAAAVIVLLLLLVFLFPSEQGQQKKKSVQTSIATSLKGADTKAAIVNQEPSAAEPVTANNTSNTSNTGSTAETAVASADAAANDTSNVFMTPAPAPGLTEEAAQGSLPRISEDGRQPWQVYARPFNTTDKRPRIAIVITDLGLARVASDAAIDRMPPNVTLAFDAQSPVVGAWCARARQAGHETLLQLPMEPFDYPRSDPGPNTLLSNLPNSDNIQRLLKSLGEAYGYVGVTTMTGSHFTTDPAKITPVLDVLRQRGLMIFDSRIAPHSAIVDLAGSQHVPSAVDTLRLDQNLAPAAIDDALNRAEQAARLTGKAVAMTAPSPIMLDRLEPWLKQLRHDGIVLAPITAMTQ